MIAIDELSERLHALVGRARDPWAPDEIAAAHHSWNAYDRARFRFTVPLEASTAKYVALRRRSGPTEPQPHALAQVTRDVAAVAAVLDRSEGDLFRAAESGTPTDARAIERRREQLASLRSGFAVWFAELQAEHGGSPSPEPDPDPDPDPPGPDPELPDAPSTTLHPLTTDPALLEHIGPVVFGIH